MSLTALKFPVDVPPDLEKTIVSPPVLMALPPPSLAVKVTLTDDPDWVVADDTEMRDCTADIGPGITLIDGRAEVIGEPLTFAPTLTAVPINNPVMVVSYVPSLLSVTAEKEAVELPPVRLKTTVAPPKVSWLVFASLRVATIFTLLPACTVAGLPVITMVEFAKEAGPGNTVRVGRVEEIGIVSTVALIVVAEPAKIPLKVAVYVPSALSVVAEMVPVEEPPELVKTTVLPPAVSWLLFPSRKVRVIVAADPD